MELPIWKMLSDGSKMVSDAFRRFQLPSGTRRPAAAQVVVHNKQDSEHTESSDILQSI